MDFKTLSRKRLKSIILPMISLPITIIIIKKRRLTFADFSVGLEEKVCDGNSYTFTNLSLLVSVLPWNRVKLLLFYHAVPSCTVDFFLVPCDARIFQEFHRQPKC
jgi:hypothetical protein